MSLNNLNIINTERPRSFKAIETIKSVYNPNIRAANDGADNVVTIYEHIGEDFWSGGGMTSKRMGGILRALGNVDIQVNINSYGGDVFEGIAIYNQLAQHKGKVTINVVGIAASAASIIAMAGDEILMGEGAMLMIHNAWTIGVGNKNDFAQIVEQMQNIDDSLVSIYEARSGVKSKDIQKLMDAETFMTAQQAIDDGFADGMMLNEPTQSAVNNHTDNKIINLLKDAGLTNSQARELKGKLKDFGIDGDVKKESIDCDASNDDWVLQAQALILKMKM